MVVYDMLKLMEKGLLRGEIEEMQVDYILENKVREWQYWSVVFLRSGEGGEYKKLEEVLSEEDGCINLQEKNGDGKRKFACVYLIGPRG